MKAYFTLLLSFLLTCFSINAQQGCFWQNPLPQGKSLKDFHIINENTIVAFGEDFTLSTTDGGNNWSVKNTDVSIYSVSFIDSLIGWAGASNSNGGIILKTVDGGYNWDIKNATYSIKDLFFIENDIGLAVTDSNIIKTTDSGETWETKFTTPDYGLSALFFNNANVGWVVGYDVMEGGKILKTTNGGDVWVQQGGLFDTPLNSIYFVNSDTGWTVGNRGYIFKTTNGGSSWFQQTGIGVGRLSSVYFIDSNIGWISGAGLNNVSSYGGYILKTTNGGINWITQVITKPSGLGPIIPLDERVVWAIGSVGMVIKTTDGGSNWIDLTEGTRNNFFSVQFIDENTGWAVGEFTQGEGDRFSTELFDSTIILKTTNGGDEWFPQYSSITEYFYSAYFTDLNTGWLVGGKTNYGAIIYKTTNGGDDWIDQSIGASSDPRYNSIYFVNNNTGWVVGFDGLVLKTTNGGTEWIIYSTGTEQELASIFFADSLNGWIVGNIWNDDDFRIFNTTDGGETWITQFISTHYLTDIFFIDSNNGWVVGMGAVLKTTNGGDEWNVQEISSTFYSVYFTNHNNGWAIGDDLIITTNGGDDWIINDSPAYSPGNNSIFFIDDNTGWIVGLNGTILKTTNGGVTFFEEASSTQPSSFLLSQNYPNPFNPSTKIKFEIPGQARNDNTLVTLKVYDLLGREIATLVNEEKPAGEYEVEFNAYGHSGEVRNLTTGIYFYQLRVGDFVETKKMVLIR